MNYAWIFFYYTYNSESENNSNIVLFPQHPHKVAVPFYREHRDHVSTNTWGSG